MKFKGNLSRMELNPKSEDAMIRLMMELVRAVEELQHAVEVIERDSWRMKAEIDSIDIKVESLQ